MILNEIQNKDTLMEYQIFWFAAIFEEHLMESTRASNILSKLFEHRSATAVSKAKLLEIPDRRFGLQDLRNEYLATGQSDWLAWASAVGSVTLTPIARNHRLKYFRQASTMNDLVGKVVSKLPSKKK